MGCLIINLKSLEVEFKVIISIRARVINKDVNFISVHGKLVSLQ